MRVQYVKGGVGRRDEIVEYLLDVVLLPRFFEESE